MIGSHAVQDLLGILAREQLVGVAPDGFGQMGAQHADGIDHGEAASPRALGLVGGNPPSRHAEGRIVRLPAPGRRIDLAHRDGQLAARRQLVARHLHALEQNHVFVRLQGHVVDDAHGSQQKPQVGGELAPDAADALDERGLLAAGDELDQAQPHLHRNRLHAQQGFQVVGGGGRFDAGFQLGGGRFLLPHVPGDIAQTGAHDEEGHHRQPWKSG